MLQQIVKDLLCSLFFEFFLNLHITVTVITIFWWSSSYCSDHALEVSSVGSGGSHLVIAIVLCCLLHLTAFSIAFLAFIFLLFAQGIESDEEELQGP